MTVHPTTLPTRRATARAVRISLAVSLACTALVGTAIAQDGDELTPFENPDISRREVIDLLKSRGDALWASSLAKQEGRVAVCLRGLPAERERLLSRVREQMVTGRDALSALGYTMPQMMPALLVVKVSFEDGIPAVLYNPEASAVYVREISRRRKTAFSELPKREDGNATERDFVEACDDARLHRWNASSRRVGGPGSLRWAVARRFVENVEVKGAPRWIGVGLTAHLDAATAPEGDGSGPHLCSWVSAATPEKLLRLLGDDGIRTATDARLVGRLVEILAQGESDLPKRIAALAAAEGEPAARFQAAFGLSAESVFTKVLEGVEAATEPCSRKGGVECVLCEGDGRATLACPNCEGLGKILCPSCDGNHLCPAPTCYGGKHRSRSAYSSEPCKVCKSGKIRCGACSGKNSKPCKLCRGSGRVSRACLACDGGQIGCPEGGRDVVVDRGRFLDEARPCPWCADEKAKSACSECSGVGFRGCPECLGAQRTPCATCGGHGKNLVTFRGSRTPGYGTCPACRGKGFDVCTSCRTGKRACDRCNNKGVRAWVSAKCRACAGDSLLPAEAATQARRWRGLERVSAQEAEEIREMITRGIEYLMTCRKGREGFALRSDSGSDKGKLGNPTLFSNSFVLWTLASCGVEPRDPRIMSARKQLRALAREALVGRTLPPSLARYSSLIDLSPGTQEMSLALRAMMSLGEDVDGALVKQIVSRLEEGQRKKGFWAAKLNSKEEGDAFSSLFALESLRVAKSRGAKVKTGVWRKALSRARSQISMGRPKDMKGPYLAATSVASNTALVVIAKAGTLGKRAPTFDYLSERSVRGGLAWLDRYFDMESQPVFRHGARSRNASDGGYAAYLFAIQRLAMLLEMDVLGGERWHVTGARLLRERRQPDGSFVERGSRRLNGPVVTTCSALLFLARATSPITQR